MPKKVTSIFKNNYRPEIPWSQRIINGNRQKIINEIRNILQLLSGFEITNLIRDLIRPNEMQYVAKKYFVGLKNLSHPINNVTPKNKHYFYRFL